MQSEVKYDFETGMQGWRRNRSLAGIPYVERTDDYAKTGQHALYLEIDVDDADHERRYGEVYVDIPYTNLDGVTITAWVYAPPGARGDDPDHPNGLHLFVKDHWWQSLYGTWQNIQEGGWTQVTLTVQKKEPVCGYMSYGFDPIYVEHIGINVCAGEGSAYQGFLVLDTVDLQTAPSLPVSDHHYDFTDPARQESLHHWDVMPDWGAEGWDAVAVQDGALVAQAHFSLESEARSTGFIGITYSPWLSLANKDHAMISVDVRFSPSAVIRADECPFAISLLAYDDQKNKWFYSDYQNVGGDDWTTVTFDLANPAQYAPGVQDYPGDILTLSSIRRVGIQLQANVAYAGTVMFDNIIVGGQERSYQSLNHGFVTASGTQFMLNEKPFRFVGANAEYLFAVPGTVVEQVLDEAQRMGITVLRVWGMGEGCESETTNCATWSRRFQPTRGQYNEATLEHFDRIVAMANERGIRLIVVLVNNWHEYGGMPQYVEWLASEYPGEIPPGVEPGTDAFHDLFYTNPHTRQWYRDYVTHLINRTNSITGIKYSEDPTIFSWELANEPRAKWDVTGKTVHQWIVQMSSFVEALDPNHMIGTGEEGWYVMTKDDADARSQLPDGTSWQELPNNYWQYGVNWVKNGEWWGSNGVDFVSDHSSTGRVVCWQDYVDEFSGAPVECEQRAGVPHIDYATIHVYIGSGACNIYRAPYCKYGFDSMICDPAYDKPYNQAWLWIEGHLRDAHDVIGKPILLEEFGFRSSSMISQASSGQTPGHIPPFTIEHRPRLYRLYLDAALEMGYNGALFWNLGYPAFADMPWDTCDSLDNWRMGVNSDAVALSLAPGPDHVTQGRYALRLDYDPYRGFVKACVDRVNIGENWVPPSATHLTRLAVDIYNDGSATSAAVTLFTSGNATWYKSKPRFLQQGWNKILVDTQSNEWQSVATNWQYNGTVNNLEDVRELRIVISGYTSPGTVYIDNLRHQWDDGLTIYADDPTVPTIAIQAQRWSGVLRKDSCRRCPRDH
ncbi:MAG: hypothetical protein ACFFA6_15365 [Promethearchaeota archaeon]